MISITGLLPPREGTNLKTKLAALVNARYKAKHRDRAESVGGHGEDTRDQRTADALLELCGVRSYSKPPLHNGSNGSDQAHTTFNDDSNPDPGRRANHEHHFPFVSGVTDDGATDRFFGRDLPDLPDLPGPESGPSASPDRADTFPGADVPCTCDCELHVDVGPDLSPGIDVRTAKPAHIIVFNVNAWEARLAGGPPVPITGDLLDQVANDLYLCFIGMESEPLKFGRARRYPTAIQTLAVIARDQQCIYPGCHNPPQHCDIHHLEEVGLDHGPTDVNALGLLCTPHHQHLHDNSQVITRNSDGTHTVRDRDTGRVIAHG